MHTLEVGNPYDPNRSTYPQTEQVRFTPEFSELVRFWPSPAAPRSTRTRGTRTSQPCSCRSTW